MLWSGVLLALLVAALAVPWYTTAVMVGAQDGKVDGVCSSVQLYSWNKAWCTTAPNSTACGPDVVQKLFLCPDGETYNWRDSLNCKNQQCANRGRVFDVSVALTAVAGVAAFIGVLGFTIRFCCEKREASSALLMAVGVIGFLSLTVGVVYFAVALPKAYTADNACTAWNLLDNSDSNPCKKFFGHIGFGDKVLNIFKLQAQQVWGPIGWICAAVAVPVYLLVLCLSYNPARPKTALQNQGAPEAVYTRYM